MTPRKAETGSHQQAQTHSTNVTDVRLCQGQLAPVSLRIWPEKSARILPRSEKCFPITRVAWLWYTEASPLQVTCLSVTVFLSDLLDTLLCQKMTIFKREKNISCISIFPEKSWSVTKEDEALVVKLGLNPRRPCGQAQRLCCEVITPLADKQHVSPSDPLFWFWLGWADSQTPSPERKDIHIRKALPNFGVNNHFAN